LNDDLLFICIADFEECALDLEIAGSVVARVTVGELCEDGSFELREDADFELRDGP